MKMSQICKQIMNEIIDEGMALELGEMDTTGICYKCSETRDGCEPDAVEYECYECGEKAVHGLGNAILDM